MMANRKQSSSCHQQQQHIDADEKLWQELNIIVALETFQFPNNKIHGTIRIEPESSRKFIQMFFFVIDNLYEYEFDPSYVDVIVSGLNMNIRNRSIYIKAIPINTKWKPSVKISKEFKFNSKVFELIPRLSFIWLDEDKIRTPHLVIQWDHIEDKYAQGYVLYLDDVMIKNIYKNQIEDQFKVTIRGFEPGKKHIFQLASKLDNGQEAWLSDRIEFTVPDNEQSNNQEVYPTEISISIDPLNLSTTNPHGRENTSCLRGRQAIKQLENQMTSRKVYTCCNQLPHDRFLGVEHYLRMNCNQLILSSPKHSLKKDKTIESSKSIDDDDDDDVIISNREQ